VVVVASWEVVEASASSSLLVEVSWVAAVALVDSSLEVVVASVAVSVVLLLVDSTVVPLLHLPLLTPSLTLLPLAASPDLSSTSAT
jgi:hypothetical protein